MDGKKVQTNKKNWTIGLNFDQQCLDGKAWTELEMAQLSEVAALIKQSNCIWKLK